MFKKQVVLVNENDSEVGKTGKMKAHKLGLLHRAFSVFIFNNKGDMLLQKRAKSKYHSGGLWSNACCSHPISKNAKKEARKRLKKEMDVNCPIEKIFSFIYTANVGDLIENELDYVFTGVFNDQPHPNKKEAEDFKWVSFNALKTDISQNPEQYTEWFKLIWKRVFTHAVDK